MAPKTAGVDLSEPTFPGSKCPCGRGQPDGDRLYCDRCIDAMAAEMADAD